MDAARVRENWFFAHTHCGGMVSNGRENVNRQTNSRQTNSGARLRVLPSVADTSRNTARI